MRINTWANPSAQTLSVAFEYERNHGMSGLQTFFDSSLPNIQHPEVQQWGRDLDAERAHLLKKGLSEELT